MQVYMKIEKRMFGYLEDSTLEYKKLVITKAFATEPKHRHRKTSIDIRGKGSIICEKCRQLTDLAIEKYPEGNVPDTQLTIWIMQYCGADKATVRAYRGYEGYIARSNCGENRVVGQKTTGYLERFGFMHRMNRSMWRVDQTFLSAYPSSLNNEGFWESKEKISLSSSDSVKDSMARPIEDLLGPSSCGGEDGGKRKKKNTAREREICSIDFPKTPN
jgi:hypothetical protein